MFFLPTTSVVVVIRDTSTTVNKLSVTGRLMMDPFVIAEGLLKTRRNAHERENECEGSDYRGAST